MALQNGQKVFKDTKFLKSEKYTKEILKGLFSSELHTQIEALFDNNPPAVEERETHLFLILALLPLFMEDPDFTAWSEDPEKFLTLKKDKITNFITTVNELKIPVPGHTGDYLYTFTLNDDDKAIIKSLFSQGHDTVQLKNFSMFLFLVLRDFVIDYLQIQQQIRKNVLDTTSKITTLENRCNTILNEASDKLTENLNSFLNGTNLETLKNAVRQSLGIDVGGGVKNGIFRATQDFYIITKKDSSCPIEGIFNSNVDNSKVGDYFLLKNKTVKVNIPGDEKINLKEVSSISNYLMFNTGGLNIWGEVQSTDEVTIYKINVS